MLPASRSLSTPGIFQSRVRVKHLLAQGFSVGIRKGMFPVVEGLF